MTMTDFRRVPRVATLSLAIVITGCTTVGPDFEKPEAQVADSWLEAHDPRVDTSTTAYQDWWGVFNDPVLNKLITSAYEENLGLQIAGLRILEARAQLGIAVGLQYPQSQSVGGSYVRSESSENSPPFSNLPSDVADRIDTSVDSWATSFDIAWEADLWGKFRRGVEAAEANLASTMLGYDAALVTLTGDVAQLYTSIRTLEQRLAYVRENVVLQQKGLKLAEDRFEFGAASRLDVAQSTSLLRATQAAVPSIEARLSQSRNALSVLLGMTPGSLEELLGEEGAIPVATANAAVGIPADLIRRRPDVRAAEMAAAAQSAAIGVATAELYPQFILAGSIGVAGESFSDQFESGSGSGFVTSLINWNIFNYGRIRNNVRVQDARFEQLLANYENVVLNAAREVEDGLAGFLRAQEEVAFLEQAVAASLESVELSLFQYDSGLIDYQRVLDSQAALLSQQDALADAQGRIADSLIRTYRALGGGWQLRENGEIVDRDRLDRMRERSNWGELLDE